MTTDNMPAYKDIPWLFARWPTDTLTQWTDTEIEARAVQVATVDRENHVLYEAAKARRNDERQAFRLAHPRKDWPSALKRVVPYPPDLMGTWKKLTVRRATRLREVDQETADKRTRFLQQMEEGRFKAMMEREQAIRQRLNQIAAARGVRLREKALDKRFEEMLIAIGLMDEVGV